MKNNTQLNVHLPRKRADIKPKWFESEINECDFTLRQDSNGMFYGHHKEWKNRVWIGPYSTEEALNKVISDYAINSKRSPSNRKEIKNLHSILMEEKDWK